MAKIQLSKKEERKIIKAIVEEEKFIFMEQKNYLLLVLKIQKKESTYQKLRHYHYLLSGHENLTIS